MLQFCGAAVSSECVAYEQLHVSRAGRNPFQIRLAAVGTSFLGFEHRLTACCLSEREKDC